MNINKLYDLYKEWLKEEYPNIECVHEHYYRHTFRERFNLGFGVPRSDTCKECDAYKIKVFDSNLDEDTRKQLNIDH